MFSHFYGLIVRNMFLNTFIEMKSATSTPVKQTTVLVRFKLIKFDNLIKKLNSNIKVEQFA